MTAPARQTARRSTRQRLSLTLILFGRVGLLFFAMVAVVGGMAFYSAQSEIDRVYDGELITGANVLRALMADELTEPQIGGRPQQLDVDDAPLLTPEDRAAFNAYAQWRMVRVWRDGRLVMRSDTGPVERATVGAPRGLSNLTVGGEHWRLYTLRFRPEDIAVQVGERTLVRRGLVQSIALELFIPLLVLIPGVTILIWLTLRNGLGVLRGLAREMSRRTARDLAPVTLDDRPRDLQPLIQSINQLFLRLDRAMQQERRFIDHAAHQLRTPLASIKLRAQMIERENDPQERRLLAAQLKQAVDRIVSLTDRLLTLARLEIWNLSDDAAADFKAEIVAAMADLAPVAAERSVTLAFSGEAILVAGEATLLRLIAANLIDNAIHHAPPESEVAVQLWSSPAAVHFVVTDQGPGVPPAERRQVFERFYRGADETGSGAGLGLAIVEEAVRLMKGDIVLLDRDDGGSGLAVRVTLPAAR